jgi:type 1 glutamine amidotransferase
MPSNRQFRTPFNSYLLAAALVVGACSTQSPPGNPTSTRQPAQPASIRVLMLTATSGFRHDSIPVARDVMTSLAAGGAFTVTCTEDLSSITPSTLAGYDVLFFALTSGDLAFSAEQKAAILQFVTGGKGFLGVHSASDTLYDWPDYGRLVGAYFKEHPWTQQATVLVEDQSHPATAGLGERIALFEEYYTFRDNPRPRVHVLLGLDPASVGATGDYPLAWVQPYGNGRAYYNALGHFQDTWRDQRFQRQLVGAIKWAGYR